VTFLFTDIEGSTRLWEEHSEVMRAALERLGRETHVIGPERSGCPRRPVPPVEPPDSR
jgi:hypothetical protein